VAFAGEAFVAAPLTQDHTTFLRTLAGLNTESVSKPGSDLGSAIRVATRALAVTNRAQLPPPRVIVLISDGEQLHGEAILAAQETRNAGLAILAAGAGTPLGAKVPDSGAYRRDLNLKNEFGRDVVSKLDERMLRQIAAASRGGSYAPLGAKGEGLDRLRVSGIEPLATRALMRSEKEFREAFQIPLLATLAFLLTEMLLNDRRKAK
jgi:Ca-activated chloride channel family protein